MIVENKRPISFVISSVSRQDPKSWGMNMFSQILVKYWKWPPKLLLILFEREKRYLKFIAKDTRPRLWRRNRCGLSCFRDCWGAMVEECGSGSRGITEWKKGINILTISVHWANGSRDSYPIVGESVEYASRPTNTCPSEEILHLDFLSKYALRRPTILDLTFQGSEFIRWKEDGHAFEHK